MTTSRGFRLDPEAANDILAIWKYIANDNPAAARRIREEILNAVRNLVFFPHQGHKRADLTSRPLRFWVVRDYLIVYVPDEAPLLVIAVLHARRSPKLLASLLNKRTTN